MLEIEITNTELTEGGLSVFARVWQDGEQIGFGKDGTVDIERFQFINPPILVPDVNGDILVETPADEIEGTNATTNRYREDPEEALLQALEHTIKVKKEKFSSSKIITDKTGNTTTTEYGVAGGSGRCRVNNATSWANCHDPASADNCVATQTGTNILCRKQGTTNWDMHRVFLSFDTSAIPDGDDISSATLSAAAYPAYVTFSNGDSADIDCVGSTQGDATALTTNGDDYDQAGTTVYDSITLSSWDNTDGNFNDFTLDSNGIANVSKTGHSTFALRCSRDTDDSAPTGSTNVPIYLTEEAGTSKDIVLVVEHAEGVGGSGPATLKTWNTVATASVKTGNTVAIASIKTINTAA